MEFWLQFCLSTTFIVLGRVQSFLPQLKEADQQLKQRLHSQPDCDLTDLDIESVEDGEAHIEMVIII